MTRNERYETPRKPMLTVGNRAAALTTNRGAVAPTATARATHLFTCGWPTLYSSQPLSSASSYTRNASSHHS